MRFASVKSQDEQAAMLAPGAPGTGQVEQRTAAIRRTHGLLSESGIVLPQKAAIVRREAAAHLEGLSDWDNTTVGESLSELHRCTGSTLDEQHGGRQLKTNSLMRRCATHQGS